MKMSTMFCIYLVQLLELNYNFFLLINNQRSSDSKFTLNQLGFISDSIKFLSMVCVASHPLLPAFCIAYLICPYPYRKKMPRGLAANIFYSNYSMQLILLRRVNNCLLVLFNFM